MNPYIAACQASGPIDTTLLAETQIRGRHADKKPLSALECTDAEFIKWLLVQIDGLNCKNRLRFRLLMLGLLPDIEGFAERHWVTW